MKDTTDWIQRWKDGETGWHSDKPNSKLIEFINYLELQVGDSVFVPLCGKTQDMLYLLEQGYRVIGVELSQLAVEQFFSENNLTYLLHKTNQFSVYQGENITLYCGDYFALEKSMLANFSTSFVSSNFTLVSSLLFPSKKAVCHKFKVISGNALLISFTSFVAT